MPANIDNPVNDEFLASSFNALSGGVEATADWVTKGVPLAVVSGTQQLWNGVGTAGNAVGNFVTGEDNTFEEAKVDTWLVNNFDDPSSYVSYYGEHKEGIDLGGFVLGSVVPSGLAVKGLNLLQKGIAVSRAGSFATGLLSNNAERYWLQRAAQAMEAGTSATKAKLLVAGSRATQTSLEILAAEAATYASMSQSPVYDGKDLGDIVGSALTGAGAFGALGGVVRYASLPRATFSYNNAETTLSKVRDTAGEVLSKAAYTEGTQNMTNLKITPGYVGATGSFQMAAKQKLDKALGNATHKYSYTKGDDIVATIRTMEKSNEAYRNAGALTNVTQSPTLLSRAATVEATRAMNNSTKLQNLFAELAGDSGMGSHAKVIADSLIANGDLDKVAQMLTGATKVTRVGAKVNKSPNYKVVDLATGTLHDEAIHTLGDLGKVTINSANEVVVDGVTHNLFKLGKSVEEFRKAAPELAHAKYAAEFKALQKASPAKGTLFGTQVAAWNLPAIEAHYRTYGSFTLRDGMNYVGDDALKYIVVAKKSEEQALMAMYPDITTAELKVRLNVADEFYSAKNTTGAGAVNGIDIEAVRHIGIEYNSSTKVPDYWEMRSMVDNEVKHTIYQEMQDALADVILQTKDNAFIKLDFKEFAGEIGTAGTITSANAELGTFASKVMHVGTQVQGLLLKLSTDTQRKFLGATNRLRATGDGSRAMTELASIRALTTGTKEPLVINLTTREIRTKASLKDVTNIPPLAKVETSEALEFMKVYLEKDLERVSRKSISNKAVGKPAVKNYHDGEWQQLYFAPPHPNDFQYKVMVSDSAGHVGMLWARSEKELASKVSTVAAANPSWIIRTPKDTDSYFKLEGVYEDILSLRGVSKIDTELANMGKLSDLAPTTNTTAFVDGILSDFARSDRTIVNNGLMLKYGQQLAEMASMKTALGQDTLGVEKLMGTLFNVQDTSSMWHKFNGLVTEAMDWTGGRAIAAVKDNWADIMNGSKSVDQATASSIASSYGANLFDSPELWQLSKAHTYRGTTQTALRKANAVMRVAVLGVDYFNALVNIIGTPILALPEMRAAFANGQDVPYMKIVGEAMKGMFGEARRADLKRYQKLNLIQENMFAYHDLLDEHALMLGAKNEAVAFSASNKVLRKADEFLNTLQTPTAFAEQSTQLFAARVADKIAELRGLKGEAADAFVTGFAKKITGNYTSAQRPLIFQGILGQAVGLFQTYTFNFYQQATRHIANGNDKSVAMMAALQGSIFGAQSLPGFNIANAGIAAWGGDEHDDTYSYLQKVVGKDTAEMVLYGSASNLLGANLWTRGDTNPRNLTGIPITPADLAQVNYYGKALGAVKQWGDSVMAGGNLKISTLEAIAHANISRPLTGIAELAMGARVTQGGTLEQAVGQDLLSVASAIRILGAKPMQEAITSAATYKFGVVQAQEAVAMNDLAYALRTEMLAEKGDVDSKVIDDFAKRYIELGGNPQGFRRWYLRNLASATTPRAKLFAEKMRNNAWATTYQELASPELSEELPTASKPVEEPQQ